MQHRDKITIQKIIDGINIGIRLLGETTLQQYNNP